MGSMKFFFAKPSKIRGFCVYTSDGKSWEVDRFFRSLIMFPVAKQNPLRQEFSKFSRFGGRG
jgi:hypothetical protein